jgi:hypothetical protein
MLDSDAAPEAAPYEELFAALPSVPWPRDPAPIESRIFLTLLAEKPGPWTDPRTELYYVPAEGLLYRHGEWVRPPAELAALIERDAGLGPTGEAAPRPGGGVPWPVVGGLAGAAAILVGALLLRRTRTRARGAAPANPRS